MGQALLGVTIVLCGAGVARNHYSPAWGRFCKESLYPCVGQVLLRISIALRGVGFARNLYSPVWGRFC
jgi:hypothetical protein